MKKLTTTLLISTLTVGGLAIAGTSMARHGDGSGHCGARSMQGKMHGPGKTAGIGHAGKRIAAIIQLEKSLDLSKEQRTAVREIMKKARMAGRVHRDILIENRLALHDLMEAEDFNEQETRRLAEIQADNKAELMLLHARTRADIRAQLTDTQREKLSELRQDRGFGYGFGHHL